MDIKTSLRKNLCAFKQLDYTLLQKHTTLIFGNNMDNDSQGSNGSGKSAMLEAIAIGITGETLRRIKMDEIINDAEDEATVSFCSRIILQESTYLLNVLSPVKQHR
ncbi:MAG: AAA family ATPase [Bacteroides stercoris]